MRKKGKRSLGGLVYSTDVGRMCPGCSKPIGACVCRKKEKSSPGDGIVRLMRQTKGRKGKGVVCISGLEMHGNELKKLAKELKQQCGSGGSIKAGVIEIQGDHRDTLEKVLTQRGYKVKRAGG